MKEYVRNSEIKPGMSLPSGLVRVALCLEYAGTYFKGFQKQASAANTIQAELDAALSFVADEPITTVCAGRTDAGVHACAQVVHFDTKALRAEKAWVAGVNSRLPAQIRVRWAREIAADFHARFSAQSRTYRFIFYSNPVRSAILQGLVTWTSYPLQLLPMQRAAQALIGKHDFSSFRAANCQASSPIREIETLELYQRGSMIVMQIQANAFLYHMVRNIAGMMIEIGRGAKPSSWAGRLLQQRDRSSCAATARPDGLYFVKVTYPDHFSLPELPLGPLLIGE